MRRFRDLSFKRKLTILNFVTSASPLLVVGLVFAAFAIRDDRQTLGLQLGTQADIIGFTVAPALIFDDARAASDALAALRAEPRILAAIVYTADGQPFSSFARASTDRTLAARPPPLDSEITNYRAGTVELRRSIRDNQRLLGSVYIRADLSELRQRVIRYAEVTVAVVSLSLLAALGIASMLQRDISGPVLDLAATARAVTLEKNYSIRAAQRGQDELGSLVDAFNGMLDRIQTSDALLHAVNRQLQARTEELGRKNEEVEAFVYIVSHDLRAPLVNLQGFSRELRMSCETLGEALADVTLPPPLAATVRALTEEEIPSSLRFISASTTKFERLISALLQLSRSGRRELAFEPLSMDAIVTATLDSLRRSIEDSGAEIVVGALPPAYGDVTAVGQVWSNLVTNALRYLQPGRPGRIVLDGGRRDGKSLYTVRDNGVGLSTTAQSKLFQVFQRMRPDLAEGEGIGLATVKRIVERHGGRIWAESVEGVGSAFTFSLPSEPPEGVES